MKRTKFKDQDRYQLVEKSVEMLQEIVAVSRQFLKY